MATRFAKKATPRKGMKKATPITGIGASTAVLRQPKTNSVSVKANIKKKPAQTITKKPTAVTKIKGAEAIKTKREKW